MESTANTPASVGRLPRAIGMMKALSRSRQQTQHSMIVISSPMGPVKTSRGADLVRSNTLTIVNGVDDDATQVEKGAVTQSGNVDKAPSHVTEDTTVKSSKLAPTSSRGLVQNSGGYLVGTPSGPNNITAKSTPQSRSHNRGASSRTDPLKLSASIPVLNAFSTPKVKPVSFATSEQILQDENTPPSGGVVGESMQQCSMPSSKSRIPKLPRSRTMGVLQEIKASISISRPSTAISSARRMSQVPVTRIESSPSTDSGKTGVSTSASSSRTWLPHASLTSLVRSSRSCTPEPPRLDQVTTAQPSAYWSGRFMALHDRFLSEAQVHKLPLSSPSNVYSLSQPALLKSELGNQQIPKEKQSILSSSQLPFSKRSTLPHANTTSSLSKVMFKSSSTTTQNEDDDRCRRIFTRLEESCLNAEARQSLQDWQQTYARKLNRPSLLPVGRSMEEKGRMARLFGGSSVGQKRKTQRRSLSDLPSPDQKGGKAGVVTVVAREK